MHYLLSLILFLSFNLFAQNPLLTLMNDSVIDDGLGDNIIVNGTFDTDVSWIKAAGWTITGNGVATGTNCVTPQDLYQNTGEVLNLSDSYEISFDVVSISAGDCYAAFAGNNGDVASSTGHYSKVVAVLGTGDTYVYMVGRNGFTGTVDNISIRKVDNP